MVLYDARSKSALTVTAIERETNALYTQAVAALREKGVVIQSIICDGKSGLLDSFPDIPVQMGQFHQIKIIMRHLTREPKSPKAQKPGSTGAAGPVADPDGDHSGGVRGGPQRLVRAVRRLPERTQRERGNRLLTLHA